MRADGAAAPIRAITVVPVGDVPAADVDDVVRRLSRRVGVPCRAGPGLSADTLPRLPHRPQLDADASLALVEALTDRGRATVVGIAEEDLGHPLFTFFFGRARRGGAALVSLHRLDPAYYGLPASRDVRLRRATLECLHELGHVAGLPHCDDWHCVMRFCGDVESLDLRGSGFCERCSGALSTTARHTLHG